MYAVIRAGGKQYRVAPGDVIRVEKTGSDNGTVQFGDVLAVSGKEGEIARPQSQARVVGQVVEEGRADKILVFHYKRKSNTRNCGDTGSRLRRCESPRSRLMGSRSQLPSCRKRKLNLKRKPLRQPKLVKVKR